MSPVRTHDLESNKFKFPLVLQSGDQCLRLSKLSFLGYKMWLILAELMGGLNQVTYGKQEGAST